jgi:hypothetical protein
VDQLIPLGIGFFLGWLWCEADHRIRTGVGMIQHSQLSSEIERRQEDAKKARQGGISSVITGLTLLGVLLIVFLAVVAVLIRFI